MRWFVIVAVVGTIAAARPGNAFQANPEREPHYPGTTGQAPPEHDPGVTKQRGPEAEPPAPKPTRKVTDQSPPENDPVSPTRRSNESTW